MLKKGIPKISARSGENWRLASEVTAKYRPRDCEGSVARQHEISSDTGSEGVQEGISPPNLREPRASRIWGRRLTLEWRDNIDRRVDGPQRMVKRDEVTERADEFVVFAIRELLKAKAYNVSNPYAYWSCWKAESFNQISKCIA